MRIHKGTIILGAALSTLFVGTLWASNRGVGLPKPKKNPPSIREGSVKNPTTGRRRTRFFVGGGIHRGK
ncbi:MAG: hypothetical protein CSA62_09815 [Planctomycetota bacterium]|nr:MAG: hypothetical protein CSA62_09815 [Planctomycetota bacterium]